MSATTDVVGEAPDHVECMLPHCAASLSFLKLSVSQDDIDFVVLPIKPCTKTYAYTN